MVHLGDPYIADGYESPFTHAALNTHNIIRALNFNEYYTQFATATHAMNILRHCHHTYHHSTLKYVRVLVGGGDQSLQYKRVAMPQP